MNYARFLSKPRCKNDDKIYFERYLFIKKKKVNLTQKEFAILKECIEIRSFKKLYKDFYTIFTIL